jgi:hypothetical protein
MIATQPEVEKLESLLEEMSLTIKNLSSLAAAHGLMNPYVNHQLHDAVDGDLNAKTLDEVLGSLKRVNERLNPEWAFLNLG